jgi:acyl-CoA synthetase (NDP forming)
LVIVTVPAAAVPQVLQDCATAGAPNVHICSAGFAETGEGEAAILEKRVRDIALKGGLQVVGPNCLGYHVPASRLKMYEYGGLTPGPVAFISQSGGHAQTFVEHGTALGINFSKVISYGNALVMDSADFLEYLATDPETGIICLYVEGVKDGGRLIQLVRETVPSKPVIIWKGGLTSSGARAAVTHTSSLSGDKRIWEAFFQQTGATEVDSIEEMADVTMTFLRLKPLLRANVAVFVGGGGNSVANADTCVKEGIEIPALTGETRTRLMKLLSLVNQSIVNPIDSPRVLHDPSLLQEVLQTVAADPLIDVIILHISTIFRRRASADIVAGVKKCVADFCRHDPSGKPVVVAVRAAEISGGEAEQLMREMREADITTYYSLHSACRALNRFAGYHAFVAQSRAEQPLAPIPS